MMKHNETSWRCNADSPALARCVLVLFLLTAGLRAEPSAELVVVVGAPGTVDYGEAFTKSAAAWEAAGKRGDAKVTVIGKDEEINGLDKLENTLGALAKDAATPLWIVLIGHGTFDGRSANFNLRGKDLEAATLAGWLQGVARPVVVINSSASSAPFLKTLSGPNRIVITATKSGSEDSYTRFGEHLASTIDSPDADLDRDGATSVLEGFLAAAKGVEEFYKSEGRIATEEALIDDNGDGLGTPADWFRGVRAVRTAKDGAEPDGRRAQQLQLVPSEAERALGPEFRRRRDVLESRLFALRARKDKMEEAAYLEALEPLLRELAEMYQQAESNPTEEDS